MHTHISRALIVSVVLLFIGFVGFSPPPALFADSINDFECNDGDKHVFTVKKPSSHEYKKVENYCKNCNGERAGATMISFTDYTGASPSTIRAIGQYHNGRRVGKWVIINDTGENIDECLYVNGDLSQGDSPLCFE
ncbi:MAG: hypothetical protein ACMUIL_14045 [bacterium]